MNKSMDTQRLILWLIFSFSAVMLWQAWERERNPPPPAATVAPATRPGEQAAPTTAVPPSAGVPAATTPAPGAPPVAAAAAGQTIEIRTDLFVADIDTQGGTITRVALDKHRDAQDPTKPYLALQRNAERTFVAQAGLIGEGLPNHRTAYEVLPGPRALDHQARRRLDEVVAAREVDVELRLPLFRGDVV